MPHSRGLPVSCLPPATELKAASASAAVWQVWVQRAVNEWPANVQTGGFTGAPTADVQGIPAFAMFDVQSGSAGLPTGVLGLNQLSIL